MCFHTAEAREFESERNLPPCRFSSCHCPVCRVVDVWASNVEHFRVIRGYVHFVQPQSCEEFVQHHDTGLMSSTFATLTVGQLVPIRSVAERRVIIATSKIVPCVVVAPSQVRSAPVIAHIKGNKPKLYVLPLLPIDPDFVYKTEKSYPQFAHKRVDFFWSVTFNFRFDTDFSTN